MTSLKDLWHRFSKRLPVPLLDVPPAPSDDPEIRAVRGRIVEYKIRVEQLRQSAAQRRMREGT